MWIQRIVSWRRDDKDFGGLDGSGIDVRWMVEKRQWSKVRFNIETFNARPIDC